MTAIDDVFTALFVGTGSWLGLLLFITLILGITFAWKYGGLLMMPVSIFLSIYYLDNSLGWHGLIMVLVAIFIVSSMVYETKKD
jgi:hypothetical protein